MAAVWTRLLLLGVFVAAVAHGQMCRRCPIGILGTCLFSSNVDCDNSTQRCFFGEARFNATGIFRLQNRGCVRTTLCGRTQAGSILGIGYTANRTCCNGTLCNGVTSVQLSLTAVCAAVLASLWVC